MEQPSLFGLLLARALPCVANSCTAANASSQSRTPAISLNRRDGISGWSPRLNVRKLHHLAPLLSFLRNELAEVAGRAWKCGGTQLGKPRLHVGISEGGVDLLVEFVNNLYGRVAWRADAGPEAKLIARNKSGHCGNVGQ